MWLRNSLGIHYQMIRIWLTREVEPPSFPIRCQAFPIRPFTSGVKRRMRNIRMKWRRRRILDVRHPSGMSAEQNSGCETSGWNVGGEEFRMWDIRVECRQSRIPDVLFGSLTKVHKPCYVISTACHNTRSVTLRWCVWMPYMDIFCREDWTSWIPKNSPQSLIALVIKKLSKHQNLT